MTEPLVQLRNICFQYPDGKEVLRRADLTVAAGERVALEGANGCGKTTVLHVIMGLLRPQQGTVTVFGRKCRTEADFQTIRGPVGLLFQDADDQLFCPTVAEDIAFGPLNLGYEADAVQAIVEHVLAQTGLDGYGDRLSQRLSVGEKRLVALATVLAMDPKVLLLDEPTAGLDDTARKRITEVLAAVPAAMVLVSHDRAFLTTLTTRSATLLDGRIA